MAKQKILLILFFLISTFSLNETVFSKEISIIETVKIWDKAPHNAFTDLEYYKGKWYCAFREGKGHAGSGDYGKIRIISSKDGKDWQSVALLEKEQVDLRDAKLSITPNGKLLLNSCEYRVDNDSDSIRNNTSITLLSDNGEDWSKSNQIADKKFWLWQTTWHNSKGYALGYRWGINDMTRLYTTTNGVDYIQLVDHLRPPGDKSNEHALLFDSKNTAHMLLRRDNPSSQTAGNALLGKAVPPYRDWEWRRLNIRIGGPSMIQFDQNTMIACVRRYGKTNWTELGWINTDTAKYKPALKLPSGGDTSYAGLVWHEKNLWISYYSSHEGKTSIYLSKAEIR